MSSHGTGAREGNTRTRPREYQTTKRCKDGLGASKCSGRGAANSCRFVTAFRYVETGHIVFLRGDSFWAMPFDLDRLAVMGEPVRLLDGVLGTVAVSREGTLAYLAGQAEARELVWVDQDGREETVAGTQRAAYAGLQLSPEGTRIVLSIFTSQGLAADIYVYDLARQT